MEIDIQASRNALIRMQILACSAWLLTTLLFAIPFYQWWVVGNVPIDRNFAVLTIANLTALYISAKASSKVKFLKYQIAYFTNSMEAQ